MHIKSIGAANEKSRPVGGDFITKAFMHLFFALFRLWELRDPGTWYHCSGSVLLHRDLYCILY